MVNISPDVQNSYQKQIFTVELCKFVYAYMENSICMRVDELHGNNPEWVTE